MARLNKSKVVFRHDLHVALWDWLANNPDADLNAWPGWNGKRDVKYHNFACDAAHKMGIAMLEREHPNKCLVCPLHFIGGPCLEPRSWQSAWFKCKGKRETRIKIAQMMRDTPISEAWSGLVREACDE